MVMKVGKKLCILLTMICSLFVTMLSTPTDKASAADPFTGYLLVHFTGESANGEQIYFATSTDGLHWKDMNHSQPVLISDIGEKGVRDPAIVRSAAGDKFYILATDLRIASGKGWSTAMHDGSTSLIIWESTDLINWSAPRMVDVGANIPNAGCVWAPEAIYDETTGDYIVYWATISPLNGVDKARIYYSRTKDFQTFTPAQLYIDRPGTQGIIDTQIIKVDTTTGGYKYYRASGDGQITFEGSNQILGTWQRIGDLQSIGLTGSQVEGPILYKFNDKNQWGLFVDQYATGKGYLPLVSSDLSNTSNFRILNSSEYSLGTNKKRHGSILNLTQKEYNAIMAKWNDPVYERIQSYNAPDRYVRHYNYDVRMDPNVSPFTDSQWRVVPGLANSGTGYVSFESVNFPGYFLRHINFDFVLARNDGSSIFKADATFKKVQGLKDAAWSSFQSYNFPSRYIRHSNYQLKLDPISTDLGRQDATFKLVN
jgi:hypothetical protein